MALVGNVTVRFGTDTADYSKGVEKAKKDNKGLLDDLKHNFGGHSALSQSLHLLAGAGAIVALSHLSSGIKDVSEKMVECSAKIATGEASISSLSVELLKAIPIAGNLGEAMANVWLVSTGQIAAEAKIKATNEDYSKRIALHDKQIEKIKTLQVEVAKLAKTFEPQTAYTSVNQQLGTYEDKARELALAKIEVMRQHRLELGKQRSALAPDDKIHRASLQADIDYTNSLITDAEAAYRKQIDDVSLAARGAVFGEEEAKRIKSEMEVYDKAQKYIRDGFQKTADDRVKAEKEAQKKIADEQREAWKKWSDENKKLMEDAKTPAENYAETVKDLLGRQLTGGISKDAFDRLAAKAREEYSPAKDVGPMVQIRSRGAFTNAKPKEDEMIEQLKLLSDVGAKLYGLFTKNPLGTLFSLPGA